MFSYTVHICLNLSVLLAAAAMIVRLRYIFRSLIPFCLLLILGSANELISLIRIHNGAYNTVNGNIFILAEFILLTRQFLHWNVFRKAQYFVCVIAGIIVWLLDNCCINNISANNSLSRIVFSFLYAFLCVTAINRHMVFDKGRLYRSPSFIITIGLLLFFACKSYVEVFNVLDLGFSSAFYAKIWFTLSVVNAVSNALFTIAMLCIPQKQKFLLQSL